MMLQSSSVNNIVGVLLFELFGFILNSIIAFVYWFESILQFMRTHDSYLIVKAMIGLKLLRSGDGAGRRAAGEMGHVLNPFLINQRILAKVLFHISRLFILI